MKHLGIIDDGLYTPLKERAAKQRVKKKEIFQFVIRSDNNGTLVERTIFAFFTGKQLKAATTAENPRTTDEQDNCIMACVRAGATPPSSKYAP